MRCYNVAFLLSSEVQNKVLYIILVSQVIPIELNEKKLFFIYNVILVNLVKQFLYKESIEKALENMWWTFNEHDFDALITKSLWQSELALNIVNLITLNNLPEFLTFYIWFD